MATLNIVTADTGDPVLRTRAAPVRKLTGELRRLLDAMVATMREAPGVGLAAPQVGISMRLIVVETPVDPEEPGGDTRLHKLANPEIVWRADEVAEDQEACLSIPGLYGDVPRHTAVQVEAMDVSGRPVSLALDGFEARVFQHEIDHLDGVLFPDRVTGIGKLYHLEQEDDGELRRVPYRGPRVSARA